VSVAFYLIEISKNNILTTISNYFKSKLFYLIFPVNLYYRHILFKLNKSFLFFIRLF